VTNELIRPNGYIRSDDEALEIVATGLRRDPAITALVDEIGSRPVAPGSFGLLMPARLRTTGEDVLVKVNANEHERRWLPAIGAVDPGVAPAVHGGGERIDELGLGWMVLERLPHRPPGFAGPEWYGSLLRAAFRWQDAARRVDLEPWHAVDAAWLSSWIDRALELDRSSDLRRLRDRFDADWAWVCEVCGSMEPAHGDVHFFNAGSREPGVPHTLVLFDPIPRAAQWPYDAAHCETLTNARDSFPDGSQLVACAAEDRRQRGLPTPDDRDVRRVSDLYCAWLAVMWRVIFTDAAPQRARSAARYVQLALAW
jgi:hypothetical protein